MPQEIGLFANTPLSLPSLMLNLAVGVGLALVLRWHFRRFGSTLSNREEFDQVFPFVMLTTLLIITIVKSSLALSLGLVGALSIVRFRTPIKEPEELAYLFLAIAMGLGLGANQVVPTVVAGLAILGAVTLFRWSTRGSEPKSLFLSIACSEAPGDEGFLDALNAVVERHASTRDLRRVDSREGAWEVTYFLDLTESDKLVALMSELRSRFPNVVLTFIDQQRLPSV